MKIVSWNCGGKFREKYHLIETLEADIYVIQECENPEEYQASSYASFACNYFWTGERNSKGLGIFAKPNIHILLNDWEKYCLRNFLSIRVNREFDLVAVWACRPYIEEYYIYQSINISKYNSRTLIIGDFNSNSVWDKKHERRTHSAVVKQLEEIGLCSAYHTTTCEQQGKESKATFHLYRHSDKPYHIDHCFTAPDNIGAYEVFDSENWLCVSDHNPIMINYISVETY